MIDENSRHGFFIETSKVVVKNKTHDKLIKQFLNTKKDLSDLSRPNLDILEDDYNTRK